MRRMIWVTAVVLALALGACGVSRHYVLDFTVRARHLRTEAVLAMDEGNVQRAEVVLVELATLLTEREEWLQVFCDHGDLHQIKAELIDAQAAIEFGIEDDFYQAISRFGEMLDHIAGVEELRLTNLA